MIFLGPNDIRKALRRWVGVVSSPTSKSCPRAWDTFEPGDLPVAFDAKAIFLLTGTWYDFRVGKMRAA
jgi:hypothetical protein